MGEVRVTNKGRKIAFNLTAQIEFEVEANKIPVRILEAHIFVNQKEFYSEPLVSVPRSSFGRSIDYLWSDGSEGSLESIWRKLRQNDSVFLHFPRNLGRPNLSYVGAPHDYTINHQFANNTKRRRALPQNSCESRGFGEEHSYCDKNFQVRNRGKLLGFNRCSIVIYL
jgi:hypothetical protein